MVRYLVNENVNYAQSIDPHYEYDSYKRAEDKVKAFFWNKDAKKPTKYTYTILIIGTISLLIAGIVDSIINIHDIKVVIDSDQRYFGEIQYWHTYESIEPDNGLREYSFETRVGDTIRISINRRHDDLGSGPMTIKIYDEGHLVRDITETDSQSTIQLEYRVGE